MTQAVVPDIRGAPVLPVYSAVILADSPIGYWRLGEPSGTNANDEGSGNHDGTYTNTPTLAQAGALVNDTNTAVLFPTGAPTKYVNMVGYTAVPAVVSLEAWVKGTAFADNGLAGWYDAGNVATCFIYLTSTQIIFYLDDLTNDTVYATPITDGKWHHMVGTYDGTVARLYMDSVLIAGPITKTFAGGTSNNTFKIAQYGAPTGTAFNASVDEVAVYDYALTAAEVAAHWRASAPGQR